MKKLANIKYPRDFECRKMTMLSDERINGLISHLDMEITGSSVSSGNILATLTPLGRVEVYTLIAECEVEVP